MVAGKTTVSATIVCARPRLDFQTRVAVPRRRRATPTVALRRQESAPDKPSHADGIQRRWETRRVRLARLFAKCPGPPDTRRWGQRVASETESAALVCVAYGRNAASAARPCGRFQRLVEGLSVGSRRPRAGARDFGSVAEQ